jgi:hypothetical protein
VRTYHRGRESRAWIDFTVHVPAGTRTELQSVSGDVTVNGVKGEVRAETVSGDVRGSNLPQLALLKSVSGDVELTVEVPANSTPVAAMSEGLLLNTLRFFDTGDGWIGEAGSHRLLLVGYDGMVADFSPGEVFAASADTALVLVCQDHEHPRDCELDLVDVASRQRQRLQAPVEGSWTSVVLQQVPTGAAGWSATSADGRVLAGVRDASGSHLVLIEPESGTVSTLATFDGWAPSAGWDRTGQYVVVVHGSDIVVLDPDPEQVPGPVTEYIERPFPVTDTERDGAV